MRILPYKAVTRQSGGPRNAAQEEGQSQANAGTGPLLARRSPGTSTRNSTIGLPVPSRPARKPPVQYTFWYQKVSLYLTVYQPY